MAEENGSNGNAITTGQRGTKIEVTVGKTVLSVVDPDVRQMFVKPKPSQGTEIAALLSRCVVPVSMGVFDIPNRLLKQINKETSTAEEMSPIETTQILREITVFKIDSGSQAMSMMTDDPIDMFICSAIENSPSIVSNFVGSVREFCNAMQEIQGQYASEGAYYLKETLGSDSVKISREVIMTPIQNLLVDLSKMSSGHGGYQILALLKGIGKVANFLGDPVIQKLYGATSALGMLNKLDYRILPDQIMYHENLAILMGLVKTIGETTGEIDNDVIARLIMVCKNIQSYLSK